MKDPCNNWINKHQSCFFFQSFIKDKSWIQLLLHVNKQPVSYPQTHSTVIVFLIVQRQSRISYFLYALSQISICLSVTSISVMRLSRRFRRNVRGGQEALQRHAPGMPQEPTSHTMPHEPTSRPGCCWGGTFIQSKFDSVGAFGMLNDSNPASLTRDVLATDATIDRKEITHLQDDLASRISGYWSLQTGKGEILRGDTFKLMIQHDLWDLVRHVQIPDYMRK